MPVMLKKIMGVLLLCTTVTLATCQSMINEINYSTDREQLSIESNQSR